VMGIAACVEGRRGSAGDMGRHSLVVVLMSEDGIAVDVGSLPMLTLRGPSPCQPQCA
jgi:hypothetical protein